MRSATRIAGVALASLAAISTISGCSSPPSRFYMLAATARPEGAAPAAYGVVIDGVGIPAVVDRSQFVVQQGPNRVLIDEFNRWAAPLGASVARTVAENLVVLLANTRIVSGPLAPSFDPAYRVTIDVQRFESIPGEAATLDALWVVRQGVTSSSGRTTVREPVRGEGYDALAAGHSRAIASLSRDIAAVIRELRALQNPNAP